MSEAGQEQKERELAEARVAEGLGQAELVGQLFESKEESENQPAGGIAGERGVEVTAQEAAQRVDPGERPGGEVGEGAVLYLTVLAEGFAEEDGGRRGAVGDLRDIHADTILSVSLYVNTSLAYYMTTYGRTNYR